MTTPRTSMDPQLDEDATGTSRPSTPRDPDTFDMFGDEPKPEPKGPSDSIPTDAEGREALGREASRR